MRVENVTPGVAIGSRTFEVTIDEATLDRIRALMGWIQGSAEYRIGTSEFYFQAGEALGYRDDPSMYRGVHGNMPPIVTATAGRQADRPLSERA